MGLYPCSMMRHTRVDAIVFRPCASDSPAHHADLKWAPPAVIRHERPAAVALARVLATFFQTGANLLGINFAVWIARLALFDCNGGNSRLLESLGQSLIFVSARMRISIR